MRGATPCPTCGRTGARIVLRWGAAISCHDYERLADAARGVGIDAVVIAEGESTTLLSAPGATPADVERAAEWMETWRPGAATC